MKIGPIAVGSVIAIALQIGSGAALGGPVSSFDPATLTPRVAPVMVSPLPPPPAHFASHRQLFGYIAADLGVGAAHDAAAVRKVASAATLRHALDYSGERITVVGVNLHPHPVPGAASGNYSFYVLRDSSSGLVLLGRMEGRRYQTSTASRHLEFLVDVRQGGHGTLVRYQVDGNNLVNVSTLAQSFPDIPAKPDLRHAF